MKVNEFQVYGGQNQKDDGTVEWPDYMSVTIPRQIMLELIKFMASSLQDENMEGATINFVGQLSYRGEQSAEELFGNAQEDAGKEGE